MKSRYDINNFVYLKNLRKISFLDKNFNIFETLDTLINEFIEYTDKKSFEVLKNLIENGLGHKFEISIIVDANILISELRIFLTKGASFLLNLLDSPFIKLYAPLWLKEEVEAHALEIINDLKVTEENFRNAFDIFLQKIKLVDESSIEFKHYFIALNTIGRKDIKDVPYAALFFSLKADAVFTKDHHFEGVPEVKIIERSGQVGKIVSIYQKGLISYLLLGAIQIILKMLIEICVWVLRFLWEFIYIFALISVGVLSGVINGISDLHWWIQIISLFLVALLIIKYREKIINFVMVFYEKLHKATVHLYNSIMELINQIALYLKISIAIVFYLCEQVEDALNAIENAPAKLTESDKVR